jgi:predicted ATP-grasp superfamily ATP-dependent carboligase
VATQVFVYESLTGGGSLAEPSALSSSPSLLQEGHAMLRALVLDFSRQPGVEVVTMVDRRLRRRVSVPARSCPIADAREHDRALRRLAGESAMTLAVAPEIDGDLCRVTRLLESTTTRLLGPGSACVRLGSDKTATADLLASRGVPVPPGCTLYHGQRLPPAFDYPAVLKPLRGAGSQSICLIPDRWTAQSAAPMARPMRLERFCPGLACSVVALCQGGRIWTLPPFEQLLSRDGEFRYLGGRLLVDPILAGRARRLAAAAVSALPCPAGYLGVDLVLGDAVDYVIEVNPRVTTSYIGLREIALTNLAGALLAVAAGRPPELCFSTRPIEFRPDGSVCHAG